MRAARSLALALLAAASAAAATAPPTAPPPTVEPWHAHEVIQQLLRQQVEKWPLSLQEEWQQQRQQQEEQTKAAWQAFERERPGIKARWDEMVKRLVAPGRPTPAAAVLAVDELAAWVQWVIPLPLGDMQRVNAAIARELEEEWARLSGLQEQLVAAAVNQSDLAADCVEELALLNQAKAKAQAHLELSALPQAHEHMQAIWAHFVGAHAKVLESMGQADALLESELSVQLAMVREERDAARGLRMVAASTREAGRQLALQADELEQEAEEHAARAKDPLAREAAQTSVALAARKVLGERCEALLGQLRKAEADLRQARAAFQEVWRKELVLKQEHALGAELAASTAHQADDLRWRRDVALAADAFAEARGSHDALLRVQAVHDAVASEVERHEGQLAEKGGNGGAGAQQHDPAHRQALRAALEDVKRKLGEQRACAAVVAQAELVRQGVVLGHIAPQEALAATTGLGEPGSTCGWPDKMPG